MKDDMTRRRKPTYDELVAEIARLNALIGEWAELQHKLIDKATAARMTVQSLYKRLMDVTGKK